MQSAAFILTKETGSSLPYKVAGLKENHGDGLSGGSGGDMRLRGDCGFDGPKTDGFFGAVEHKEDAGVTDNDENDDATTKQQQQQE